MEVEWHRGVPEDWGIVCQSRQSKERHLTIMLYPKCWRGRSDCNPIHCIASASPEESNAESFVCCGSNESRSVEQDIYRLCFKNAETDEISDNDVMDLTSILAVISAALNLDAIQKVNNGIVEIPAKN